MIPPIDVVITTQAPQSLEEVVSRFQHELITLDVLRAMRHQVNSFLCDQCNRGNLEEVPAFWVLHHLWKDNSKVHVVDEEHLRQVLKQEDWRGGSQMSPTEVIGVLQGLGWRII